MKKQRNSYKRLCKMEEHITEFKTFVIQRVQTLQNMIKAEKYELMNSRRKSDRRG